jgi:hypothetical protein
MKYEMGGTCSTHGRDEKLIQYFVEKPEEKRPFRTTRRWENNIKMDLK